MIGKAGILCKRIMPVDYLVVAGGGSGGSVSALSDAELSAGGGGAGGLLSGAAALLRGQSLSVSVGGTGQSSSLGAYEAAGGGGGGGVNADNTSSGGASGGSGGGGAQTITGTTSGGAGTSSQGSAGAGGTGELAGGGGGALAAATGAGAGSGVTSSITGSPVVYAVGGPAGSVVTPSANTGSGGSGGQRFLAGMLVSGAGTSAVNGLYALNGTYNGKPLYRLGSTTYYIAWDGTPAIVWKIISTTDFISRTELYVGPAEPSSPAGSTTVGATGSSPAPTISEDIDVVNATSGASGVVVVAYPSTLPSLTVGAGLTYDEPSRSGYRVYRFTAGSGTITLP